MSDKPRITRRDTLKLASAVTALGAGLGVIIEPTDAAAAESAKLRADGLGSLSIKLWKLDADGKPATLIDTIDLGALTTKLGKAGSYSFKFYQQPKNAEHTMIAEQPLLVETVKDAPKIDAIAKPKAR